MANNTMAPEILIVESPYYDDISKMLLDGACQYLDSRKLNYTVIQVAGALEIPAAISFAEMGDKAFGAYVALGCVIRGETYHFDVVANESARGLMDLGVHMGLAIGNGILTVDNKEQALERAHPDKLNKGYWAARAAVEMMELRAKLSNADIED